MGENPDIDVIWGSVTEEREGKHLATRIPIYTGLIRWSLVLVQKTRKHILEHVRSKQQLGNFIAGQHQNWTDSKNLKHAGIEIQSGADRDKLAVMLNPGRFDYFPRSVVEINRELKDFSHLNLPLKDQVVIKYPTALYFYVSKDNPTLSNAIEAGLE